MNTSLVSFEELLKEYHAYAAQQRFDRQPASLYDPIRYAMGTKGKSVRPLLVLLASQLGNANVSGALPAAYALELFHNFTLVHDDIMDNAPLRRGNPSVYAKYGVASAILSGDTMLIHTYGYLLDHYQNPLNLKLISIFQAMAISLCEGQQYDMDMEADPAVKFGDYLRMIQGKTGVLITASLEIGGLIGGLDTKDLDLIKSAGDWAGRAFQIQDDLLDTFRSSKETGKSSYGDIIRGKQSAPYIQAISSGNTQQVNRLQEIYEMSTEQRKSHVQEVLGIFNALNVEQELTQLVVRASTQANDCIGKITAPEDQKNALIHFLEKLSVRRT